MDWIADVDRWDKLLHSEGVTDADRTRLIEAWMNVHCLMEKAIRDASAYRARCKQAARLLPFGATEAAQELGVHRVTVYRMAKVAQRA